MKIPEWIRESNLIEGVDDPLEDRRSYRAWLWFNMQPLTFKTILQLHRKIMWVHLDSQRSQRGFWRTVNVSVGGRVCPGWRSVPWRMLEWMKKYGNINVPFSFLVESAIQQAHIKFQKIHPFVDGNGRTGRMIMNLHRTRCGFAPLCIKASERWNYYEWFKDNA